MIRPSTLGDRASGMESISTDWMEALRVSMARDLLRGPISSTESMDCSEDALTECSGEASSTESSDIDICLTKLRLLVPESRTNYMNDIWV